MDVWLLLTNPYAYQRSLQKAIAVAEAAATKLRVVFVLDPEAMNLMMQELAESGWLGPGSLRLLENSLMEGYQMLAGDVLEDVAQELSTTDLTYEVTLKEASLQQFVQGLLAQKIETVLISSSHPLLPGLEHLAHQVTWIQG